jgi:hypothetical protein
MENGFILLLGLAFTLITSFYLLISKRRRDLVLDRLRLARRRGSGARTPPRSLSPKKDESDCGDPDYKDVFPPSRRFTLATAAPEIVAKYGEIIGNLESVGEKKPERIPLDVPFDQANPNALTPTEFSVEEIKALGDFPDYATLSGVPLPQPYTEFDINKAKPRPYRPFRWSYHQTMCKLVPSCLLDHLQLTHSQRSQKWNQTGG